jgi:soluble lytic murein transglycosylase
MRKALALAVLVACHDTPPVPAVPTPVDAGTESAAIDAAVAIEDPPSIPDLARDEDWPGVAKAIDALSGPLDPGMKFLRARAAIETGDAKGALERLDGLELPAIKDEIERLRARAELEVGPFAHAGDYFSKHTDAESILFAAKAFASAGEPAKANFQAARIVHGSFSRGAEAKARAFRIETGSDPEETDDAAWLEVKAADLAESASVSKAKKHRALKPEELGDRARLLADAGKTDDALKAVDEMPEGVDKKRARGDVLYRGKRYDDAAKALADASTLGNNAHAPADAFLSARALSRADHDEDAAKAWAEMLKKWPAGYWSDEAAFMMARLDFLHARWADAAKNFDDYLTKFPYAVERKDAMRGRAIAKLLSGDAASARKLFSNLEKTETDTTLRARLENLEAIAANKSGDTKFAVDTWTRIASSEPLSWPAIVARARLADAKATVPAALAPTVTSGTTKGPLDVVLPPDVALLHSLGLDGEAERHLAKSEAALRASAGDRGLEAVCKAYGMLDRGKRRMALSTGVASAVLDAEPSPATRWAWECAFPAPFGHATTRAETLDSLPVGLSYAVMRQESGFDPGAISPARAIGAMQLLPETASAVATEMNRAHDAAWLVRPSHNIALGSHYLATLITRFHGKLPLAVASYNCGPETVEKWTSRSTGLEMDMFVETIPYTETRNYVVHVMSNYARYAYLAKGAVPNLELALQ